MGDLHPYLQDRFIDLFLDPPGAAEHRRPSPDADGGPSVLGRVTMGTAKRWYAQYPWGQVKDVEFLSKGDRKAMGQRISLIEQSTLFTQNVEPDAGDCLDLPPGLASMS